MQVLVVWEPILATDWGRPGRIVLARLPDRRVRQFWDPNHLVATALRDVAKQHPPQPEPNCCVDKGFFWDQAIVFPAGDHWKNPPPTAFWNGPVYRIIPSLDKALADQASLSPPSQK